MRILNTVSKLLFICSRGYTVNVCYCAAFFNDEKVNSKRVSYFRLWIKIMWIKSAKVHCVFLKIIFTLNMNTKKLNKKTYKTSRTQPSLETLGYNEGCKRHKY